MAFVLSTIILAILYFPETMYGLPVLNLVACVILSVVQFVLWKLGNKHQVVNFIAYPCTAVGATMILGIDWKAIICGCVYGIVYYVSEKTIFRFT
jgi:hypothetical protein